MVLLFMDDHQILLFIACSEGSLDVDDSVQMPSDIKIFEYILNFKISKACWVNVVKSRFSKATI